MPALPVSQIDATSVATRPSGLGEFDRVLGGGFVPGAVVLVSGEPGVGKSTLLLAVAAETARAGHRVLYVTGEETTAQVRLRADRMHCLDDNLLLAAENELGAVLGHLEAVQPDLLIVDSVQTVASAEVDGAPGNVSQVREVASVLVEQAKKRNLTTLLVGHVTKDGSIAGPRSLEHVVDVVCQVEGERDGRLRLVRTTKNRFGPTDEVGCFEMVETGIAEVSDPSALFTSRRDLRAPGSCVTVTLEGRRPMVVEVQALVCATGSGQPRRAVTGLDGNRAAIVQAVLINRLRLTMGQHDIFLATVGGAVLREPAADLAIALSLASSAVDSALPAGLVAFGEIGLSGEIRPVPGLSRRLAEASRLGFRAAAVPLGCVDPHDVPPGLTLIEVGQLVDVLRRGVLDAASPIPSRPRAANA